MCCFTKFVQFKSKNIMEAYKTIFRMKNKTLKEEILEIRKLKLELFYVLY